jgi:hypothetical protein
MTDVTDSTARLLDLLQPVLVEVDALDPSSCDESEAAARLLDALRARFPHDGPQVRTIGELLARGIDEGWLCTQGEPEARFSRVAKASPATHDLSIDVVSLEGPALRHTHPRGEITLGFAAAGDPRFDGHPAGWVFMRPGSTHTPTVVGGRMHLLYFLPGGAVEWHRG